MSIDLIRFVQICATLPPERVLVLARSRDPILRAYAWIAAQRLGLDPGVLAHFD